MIYFSLVSPKNLYNNITFGFILFHIFGFNNPQMFCLLFYFLEIKGVTPIKPKIW